MEVDEEQCVGCKVCLASCPFEAIIMEPAGRKYKNDMAIISLDACTECGFCVADCDYDAIILEDSRQNDFIKKIYKDLSDRQNERDRGEKFLQVFVCERSIDLKDILNADMTTLKNVDHTMAIPVSCIGVVSPTIIENSLRAGAAGVAIVGCQTLDCQYREGMRQEGNLDHRHQKLMTGDDSIDKKVRMMWISAFDSKGVEQKLSDFLTELKDGKTNEQ